MAAAGDGEERLSAAYPSDAPAADVSPTVAATAAADGDGDDGQAPSVAQTVEVSETALVGCGGQMWLGLGVEVVVLGIQGGGVHLAVQ